jgi:chromosome segregation ATPase
MATRKRKKILPAYRGRNAMHIPMETWHAIGEKQREVEKLLIEIQGDANHLTEENNRITKRLEQYQTQQLQLEDDIKRLRDERSELQTQVRDLTDRLKWSDRRTSDVVTAFNSVASAADGSALVAIKMVRLLDDLDLQLTIREKKRG